MNKVSRGDIEEVLNGIPYDSEDIELRESYSGRGMYGEKCIGFVAHDIRPVIHFLMDIEDKAAIGREMIDDLLEDNMGRSMIYYFPHWQLEEDGDDEG